MSRGQTFLTELRCPKQRCSSTMCGVSPLADLPGVYDFVRACITGSPCRTPLLYVPMHRAPIYLSEARFSVLPSHWIVSLLLHSVFQPAVTKKSLKGVPSMCCKWFICKSRHTREKSSQIMCGKGFVASCHASINCLTLWKNSLKFVFAMPCG